MPSERRVLKLAFVALVSCQKRQKANKPLHLHFSIQQHWRMAVLAVQLTASTWPAQGNCCLHQSGVKSLMSGETGGGNVRGSGSESSAWQKKIKPRLSGCLNDPRRHVKRFSADSQHSANSCGERLSTNPTQNLHARAHSAAHPNTRRQRLAETTNRSSFGAHYDVRFPPLNWDSTPDWPIRAAPRRRAECL